MNIKGTVIALAAIAPFILFVPGANAQCAISASGLQTATPLPRQASPQVQGQIDPAPADIAGDSARDNASIVGFWKVTFTSGGQVVDQGFNQWHSDGTEILSDTANGPAHGNICMGAWTKTGSRTYKLNHFGLSFDSNGNFTGITQTREQLAVARGGNSFSGSFSIDFFDLSGNVIMHIDGEVAGTRITVD